MSTKIGRFLKHWPTSYSFANKVYFTFNFRHLKEYLLGTEVREREWATKHFRGGDDWSENSRDDWVKSYWNSQNHPHRAFLIERISKFSPNSILEVGCNCGPNLLLLANKFPNAKIRGVDSNPMAIQKGNEWLAQEGISNVRLLEGKADELGQFNDKSFDMVFTDAVLIYIGPDKIKEVMKERIRITRSALILMEWHSFESERMDPEGLGVYYQGSWKRDYMGLLKQFVREEQINVVTKITEDVWHDKNWKEVGAVIEVLCDKGGST